MPRQISTKDWWIIYPDLGRQYMTIRMILREFSKDWKAGRVEEATMTVQSWEQAMAELSTRSKQRWVSVSTKRQPCWADFLDKAHYFLAQPRGKRWSEAHDLTQPSLITCQDILLYKCNWARGQRKMQAYFSSVSLQGQKALKARQGREKSWRQNRRAATQLCYTF